MLAGTQVCFYRLLNKKTNAAKTQGSGGFCSTYGNRTRHSSVKGRRLSRLTNAPSVELECKYTAGFFSSKKINQYF